MYCCVKYARAHSLLLGFTVNTLAFGLFCAVRLIKMQWNAVVWTDAGLQLPRGALWGPHCRNLSSLFTCIPRWVQNAAVPSWMTELSKITRFSPELFSVRSLQNSYRLPWEISPKGQALANTTMYCISYLLVCVNLLQYCDKPSKTMCQVHGRAFHLTFHYWLLISTCVGIFILIIRSVNEQLQK